jgi:hypothetical protein
MENKVKTDNESWKETDNYGCEQNLVDSENGPLADSGGHGNEASGSIKSKEYLDWARYQLLKDSAPWS